MSTQTAVFGDAVGLALGLACKYVPWVRHEAKAQQSSKIGLKSNNLR